ncbi:DUF2141 domain-containing protein [Cytophagales bacterium LB-30]|uniref:DUF2141 domain-containing protein n=2 Tax=Shiella aurantiaca TaxID=3058365 RepID=A0ABT8F4W6_9BACT|nr:DUF2141 domain-containing protein [Shiella aurantiaca]
MFALVFSLFFFQNQPENTPDNVHNLTVTVKNVSKSEGIISVSIYNTEDGFLKTAYKKQKVSAVANQEVQVVFDDLPAGTYTVSAVHDVNSNGELDTNFFGMPTEPYAISKDGKNMYGPPSFDKAVFEITQDQSLDLQF